MSDIDPNDNITISVRDFENNYVSRLSYDVLRGEVDRLRAAAYELSIAVIQYGMDMTDGKWKFVKRANTDLRAALKGEGG